MFSLLKNRIVLVVTATLVTLVTLEFIKLKYNLNTTTKEKEVLQIKVESLTSEMKYNEKQCESKITQLQNESDFNLAQEMIKDITTNVDVSNTVDIPEIHEISENIHKQPKSSKKPKQSNSYKKKPTIHVKEGYYKL